MVFVYHQFVHTIHLKTKLRYIAVSDMKVIVIGYLDPM